MRELHYLRQVTHNIRMGSVTIQKMQQKDRNYIQLQKNECLDIISKGYNTLGTFEANFKALCAEGTIAGAESIFEIPFSASRGRVIYTWGVKHEKKDQWTKLAKGGINGPIPTLFYDYDVEDVRRDITCVPFKWTSDNDGDIA